MLSGLRIVSGGCMETWNSNIYNHQINITQGTDEESSDHSNGKHQVLFGCLMWELVLTRSEIRLTGTFVYMLFDSDIV
jgi:hypothetical protein